MRMKTRKFHEKFKVVPLSSPDSAAYKHKPNLDRILFIYSSLFNHTNTSFTFSMYFNNKLIKFVQKTTKTHIYFDHL